MAIASHSAPSFCCTTRPESFHSRFWQPIWRRARSSNLYRASSRPPVAARLNNSSDGGEVVHELNYSRRFRGSGAFPVYVALPPDVVGPTAQAVRRKRTMAQSFRALAAAGVEGLVMEVWWGLVEREFPGIYNWQGYLEIVEMANRYGLKVRAVMAFHQCGLGPEDPFWIPLPLWVLQEMERDPNLSHTEMFGRRNTEYISLGCDILPILQGRSPIQAYADLMRNFRDTFKSFLGGVITGIQVGLGPGGELRYPWCPTQKLTLAWRELQCYDKVFSHRTGVIFLLLSGSDTFFSSQYKLPNSDPPQYMLAYLGAELGGCVGPASSDSTQIPEDSGGFFLRWCSHVLLSHGERICREAEMIFRGSQVDMSGKIPGIWDWFPMPATMRMLGRHGFALCCSRLEMGGSGSGPGSTMGRLVLEAKACDVRLEGECRAEDFDGSLVERVVRMSRVYSDGVEAGPPSFSFNFVRMDRNLFEPRNWVSFTRFVRQMAAGPDIEGGATSFFSPVAAFGGGVVVC